MRNYHDVLERPCLLKYIRYFFRALIVFVLLYELHTYAPKGSELGGLLTGKHNAVHLAAIWPPGKNRFFSLEGLATTAPLKLLKTF